MRKILSLMLSLMIVLLSSLPMVPLASACAPAHDLAMHAMEHDSDMQAHHQDEHADMQTMLSDGKIEAGQACIECGCGCHDSIDSLPHLLAPHSPDTASQSMLVSVERLAVPLKLRLKSRAQAVFSPPPRFI